MSPQELPFLSHETPLSYAVSDFEVRAYVSGIGEEIEKTSVVGTSLNGIDIEQAVMETDSI